MIVGCLHAAESAPSLEDDEHEINTAQDAEITADHSSPIGHDDAALMSQDNDQYHDTTPRGSQPHDFELGEMLGTLEQGSQPHQFRPEQSATISGNKNLQSDAHEAVQFALEEPSIEGIDTVDLEQPQGNWLFKRIWWERAEARYEKIKKKIEEIFEHRMIFFTKRSELYKNILDPFYLKIGMGQGEFQAILTELLESIEKEKEKKGVLTLPEREIFARLTAERDSLAQLSTDLHNIGLFEQQVDASLNQLLEQINAIRGYDRQAWDAFKEIARVVDDQQARQLYYKVETTARNIKDIGDYLENSFSAHFDELVSSIKEQTDRVTAMVAALKEKGIDFKKQVEMLTSPKSAPVKKEIEAEEEEPEEQGFFSSYIISPLSAAWNGIVSVVTWPYHALFGSKEEDEEETEE
jgi:hypothetical protein